jgi:hypothetical protein
LEHWLAKAQELFPELERVINHHQNGSLAYSPVSLWDDLYLALEKAYDAEPPNDNFIARIYDYAAWCFRQPDTGTPVPTCQVQPQSV